MDIVEKVAFFYHKDKLSQPEIARRLKISQAQVSRLLKKAEDEKIVIIDVKSSYLTELNKKVSSHLNLKDTKLVFSKEDDMLYCNLGQEAAKYFEEIVQDGFKIGISGGRTITQFVEALSSRPREVEIYPLTLWGITEFVESVNPIILISILYHKFRPKARCLRYELPPLKGYEAFKKDLEKNINITRKALTNVDILLTGVGYLDKVNPFFQLTKIKKMPIENLQKKGIVGNIFSHTLNVDGQKIQTGLEDYILELLPLENLKKLAADKDRYVILVSGGKGRLEVIKACVRAKLFNVLISDNKTGEELLKI